MASQRIDLVSTRTFRVCSALSAGVFAFLGLVAVAAAGKVGRAHPELLLAGIGATTFVWTAASVVFRVGRRRAVSLRVEDHALVLEGVMLHAPLRLANDDVMLVTFDASRVRASGWRHNRFRIAGARQGGWLFGVGRSRTPLPILNVESFTPNVAVIFTRPVEMPATRRLFRFFLGRYPFHRGSRGPLRGLAFAAADLAAARATLQPLGVTRDPQPVDLEMLLDGPPAVVPVGA